MILLFIFLSATSLVPMYLLCLSGQVLAWRSLPVPVPAVDHTPRRGNGSGPANYRHGSSNNDDCWSGDRLDQRRRNHPIAGIDQWELRIPAAPGYQSIAFRCVDFRVAINILNYIIVLCTWPAIMQLLPIMSAYFF